MNIRKSFIVIVTLVVIQLSFINSINASDDSDTNPIISNSKRFKRRTRGNAALGNSETEWEKKLKEIKRDIEEMKNSPDVYKIMAERINKLEDTVELLQKRSHDSYHDYSKQIETLQDKLNTYGKDVGDLEKEGNLIKYQVNKRDLIQETIVQNIIDKDFDKAVANLGNLTGNFQENINMIVHDIYVKPKGSFNKILLFADNENITVKTSLAIYKALVSRMGYSNGDDIAQSLQAMKNLDTKIKDLQSDFDYKSQTESLKEEFQSIVIEKTSMELKNAVPIDDFSNVSKIFHEIDIYYPEFFEVMIRDVIYNVLYEVDLEKLVNFFDTLDHANQCLFALSALYHTIKIRMGLNQEVVVAIAFSIKNISNKNITDNKVHTKLFELYSTFPESVYNLIFPDPLCIKHVKSNEYLYLESRNSDKVLTHLIQGQDDGNLWYVDKKLNENKYSIRNFFHDDKTLTAVEKEKNDRSLMRKVHIANPTFGDDSSFWKFVPSGKNVYIKNALYDEYLYVSEDRHAYTTKMKGKGKDKASLWAVGNC